MCHDFSALFVGAETVFLINIFCQKLNWKFNTSIILCFSYQLNHAKTGISFDKKLFNTKFNGVEFLYKMKGSY